MADAREVIPVDGLDPRAATLYPTVETALQVCLDASPRLGETVVVVGDTPYDAEAATKAGLKTVGVLCGGFPAADLTRAGCVALYQDPADLLANYRQSPLA